MKSFFVNVVRYLRQRSQRVAIYTETLETPIIQGL